jgi:hypothetical protein
MMHLRRSIEQKNKESKHAKRNHTNKNWQMVYELVMHLRRFIEQKKTRKAKHAKKNKNYIYKVKERHTGPGEMA